MAHDQGAQPTLAGVERGGLKELAQLVNLHLRVHGIQPRVNLLGELFFGLFLQNTLVLRKRNFHLEVLGQRQVDGEDGTSFLPLGLPRTVRLGRSGQIQSCD